MITLVFPNVHVPHLPVEWNDTCRAGGTGPVSQAKTRPLFSANSVMIVAFTNAICMNTVMIVTIIHYLPLKYHQNAPASNVFFPTFPGEDPRTHHFGYGLTTHKMLPPALTCICMEHIHTCQ